jgi:3-polyprenyl-4-hydroxybenzoate decarboxylase
MKSIETVCILCEKDGSLTRVPSMPTYVKPKTAGSIVKQHIEEAREQLNVDKKESRREMK